MIKKIFTYMNILSLIMLSTLYSAEDEGLTKDYSGLTMIAKRGKRITDDTAGEGGGVLTVTWLCKLLKEDEENQEISRLNLSRNYIGDDGAKFLQEYFNKEDFLENLKILDLSHNKVSEKGIINFIPLLKREQFRYLIIYGNNGAASEEGIENLASTLAEMKNITDRRKISYYLRKVIWVPESWLKEGKSVNSRHYNPKTHQKFYSNIDYIIK